MSIAGGSPGWQLASPASASHRVREWVEGHAAVILILFTAIYFAGTILRAGGRPLWFDEILTLEAAKQPTLGDTLRAARVFDAMPPLTHAVAHFVVRWLGSGEIAMRIPGMVGFWIFCVCLFRFVSRSVGVLFGAMAMLLPFATASYGYSFEARCYGMLLGFAGVALVSWQAAARQRSPLALFGLALGIGGVLLCHYFGVLIYLPLAGAEVFRSWQRKRIDRGIWAAFAAGLLPLIAEIPAIRSAAGTNSHPWSTAHAGTFLSYYEFEFTHALVFLVVATVAAAAAAIFRGESKTVDRKPSAVPHEELLAGVLFLCVPIAAIAIALALKPHLFVDRYAVVAIAGFCIVTAFLAAPLSAGRPRVALAIAAAALLPFFGELAQARRLQNPFDTMPVLHTSLEQGPVVLTDGVLFLQAWHYAPEPLKSRLVYIADVPSAVKYLNVDTIDLNLTSLQRVVSNLPVSSYANAAVSGKSFRMFVGANTGWLPSRLADDGAEMRVERWTPAAAIVRVVPR